METLKGDFKVVKQIVSRYIDVKRPIMIWGGMGIGKSTLVRELGEAKGYEVRDIRLSLHDPIDFVGAPRIVKVEDGSEVTKFFPPSFLPTSKDGKNKDGKVLVFFDELNQANRMVQAAALQIMLDRTCGDYVLPDNAVIIAAGNRQTDNAFVQPLSCALENRMGHIEMEASLDPWIVWARGEKMMDEIVDFVQFKSDLFYKNTGEPAFPTPRSWTFAEQLIKGITDDKLVKVLLASTVGIGAATEYDAWMKVYRKIDVEKILDKGEIPDLQSKDASVKYALVLSIAGLVRNNKEKGREDNLAKFLKAVPTEFQVLFFKNITTQKIQKLLDNKSMEEFVKLINKVLE